MESCVFCKIVRGEIPAQKVFQDDAAIVLKDLDPQAPVHLLAIPRDHYAGIHEIPADRVGVISALFRTVSKVVIQEKLLARGYRLVVNFGPDCEQAVPHIHIHILSGRPMKWPPG